MSRQPHHVIQAGSSSQILLLYATDPATGGPARGLRHDAPGARAAYLRAGETRVRAIELVEGVTGSYRAGGLVEVDPELLPGVYQLGVPDAALAAGAEQVMVSLQVPGAAIDPVDLALVAYDPMDSHMIGMHCLEWEVRWSFLRQALPRLAERELELQRQAEAAD